MGAAPPRQALSCGVGSPVALSPFYRGCDFLLSRRKHYFFIIILGFFPPPLNGAGWLWVPSGTCRHPPAGVGRGVTYRSANIWHRKRRQKNRRRDPSKGLGSAVVLERGGPPGAGLGRGGRMDFYPWSPGAHSSLPWGSRERDVTCDELPRRSNTGYYCWVPS